MLDPQQRLWSKRCSTVTPRLAGSDDDGCLTIPVVDLVCDLRTWLQLEFIAMVEILLSCCSGRNLDGHPSVLTVGRIVRCAVVSSCLFALEVLC